MCVCVRSICVAFHIDRPADSAKPAIEEFSLVSWDSTKADTDRSVFKDLSVTIFVSIQVARS
jgi:hypothetical protein